MIDFLYNLMKDMNNARIEFVKTQSKDKYIEYLEVKNSEIIQYADGLEKKIIDLESEILKQNNKFILVDKHLSLLKKMVTQKDVLEGEVSRTLDEKIILEELIMNKYLSRGYYSIVDGDHYINLNDNKRLEILNFVKNK